MMEQPAQFTLRTFELAPPIGRQVLAGPIDEKVGAERVGFRRVLCSAERLSEDTIRFGFVLGKHAALEVKPIAVMGHVRGPSTNRLCHCMIASYSDRDGNADHATEGST